MRPVFGPQVRVRVRNTIAVRRQKARLIITAANHILTQE
jgi:hypothetical protein